MLKIVGQIIVTLSASLMGYMASHRLSLRVNFLEKYIKFILFLQTEVRYSASSLDQLLKKYKDTPMLSNLLKHCIEKLESGEPFYIAWKESINEIPIQFGLKAKDINLIKDFGNGLGTTDIEGQISHCQLNLQLAQASLENAIDEKNKKFKLYIILGLFSGISIALLLS